MPGAKDFIPDQLWQAFVGWLWTFQVPIGVAIIGLIVGFYLGAAWNKFRSKPQQPKEPKPKTVTWKTTIGDFPCALQIWDLERFKLDNSDCRTVYVHCPKHGTRLEWVGGGFSEYYRCGASQCASLTKEQHEHIETEAISKYLKEHSLG